MGSSELGFRRFLSAIIPDLAEAVKRFPVEVLIAACLTGFLVFDIYEMMDLKDNEVFRVAFALISAFFWRLAINLRAQRHKLDLYFSAGLTVPGFAIIGLLHSFPLLFEFNFALFLPALILSVGLMPYIGREKGDEAFWLFNHRLWIGATLALVGAIVFSGGLSLVVKTVEALFAREFPDAVHFDIWTIGMGFVFPLAWLSFIPKNLEERVHIGRQTEFTSSAVAVIVKFILIPLLLLNTLILFAYSVKIGFDGHLPNGRIGMMVLLYGLVGAITVLFAYPSHNSGGPLTKFFWRYWFALSIVPVGMLTIALFLRITQYGFTSDRYIAWMAVLWLGVFAVLFTLRREKRNLRLMIGVLCVFMLVASLGPWGARGIGIRHQTAILEGLLIKNALLQDGKIIPIKVQSKPELKQSNLRQIKSIVWYLQSEDGLNRLARIFPNSSDSPFPLSAENTRYVNANKVFQFMGIHKITKTIEGEYIEYYADGRPSFTSVREYAVIAGPVEVSQDKKSKTEKIQLGKIGNKSLLVHFSSSDISIYKGEQSISKASISELMQNVSQKLKKADVQKAKKRTSYGVLFHKIEGYDTPAAFMVERLTGKIRGTEIEDYSIRLWILVGESTK